MKYIMLPIHSNWLCLVLNGIKKIEVRSGTRLYNAINKLIKEQGKAPCLIYCTKGKPYLYRGRWLGMWFMENNKETYGSDYRNGKVVAEFEASAEIIKRNQFSIRYTETLNADELAEHSRLNQTELSDYLGIEEGTAIHIHNLKIFDKPKGLKEFKYICKRPQIGDCEICYRLGEKVRGCHNGISIDKAPQSFMYCEVEE